ncbi:MULTISPECIES: NmrA family NAD(P)-binding protein [Microbacterium]|uniref:NmrA family NAD(P)-binding protein n=1 Tax=Microbacterium TaxID=33882 RepID=UPI00217E4077|nr:MULTISPECIES: NAD(P)H-binding protein [Microbacterium]UWF77069.1 NAD(P)H-binding protein [Microbacterium neungamense]WCM55229.1 NAD(P)H-binding protein [Microbacterium sp. EF45047]
MRIAVTTPNGHVGRHLTRALIRAGVRPRVLLRDAGRLDAELRDVVDVAEADSRVAEDVVAATRGVDALHWISPPAAGDDPLAEYARAREALVRAVTANGIRRVVFQSSVGAEKRHGAGEIDGLAATEVALDELGIDVVHLRCGYFFTNLAFQVDAIRAGTIPVLLPPDARMPWVAPRDIAEVAAGLLLNTGWSGRRVQAAHGPADLSWNDVAALLTAEIGRRVTAERIADEEMREAYLSMGMSPAWADAMIGMSAGLRDGFVPEQPRTVASTTPTTLRSWIRDELAAIV